MNKIRRNHIHNGRSDRCKQMERRSQRLDGGGGCRLFRTSAKIVVARDIVVHVGKSVGFTKHRTKKKRQPAKADEKKSRGLIVTSINQLKTDPLPPTKHTTKKATTSASRRNKEPRVDCSVCRPSKQHTAGWLTLHSKKPTPRCSRAIQQLTEKQLQAGKLTSTMVDNTINT